MATFERYFLTDKETHKEVKGYYYTLRDREDICDMILDEFGVEGEHRHIINGHVPVKAVKGEKPIKANGKLMVIDGGFSKAYQPETGIAGYTLVYHSRGFQLVQHEPFTSTQKAIEEGQDIKSTTQIVELSSQRMMVKDTDKGRELMVQIEDLKKLLVATRTALSRKGVFKFSSYSIKKQKTLSKILCKWKQDSAVSLFLYLDSVFKNKHKLIHNQAPVMNRLCPFLLNLHK